LNFRQAGAFCFKHRQALWIIQLYKKLPAISLEDVRLIDAASSYGKCLIYSKWNSRHSGNLRAYIRPGMCRVFVLHWNHVASEAFRDNQSRARRMASLTCVGAVPPM
jgi:hypothetical protein